MSIAKSAVEYAEMIKLGHTLFALPFAFSALALAYICGYNFTPDKFVWVTLAFAGARSAAMGFNRIADAAIDAKNPRTKDRALCVNKISKSHAAIFVVISAILMVLSAYMLNKLCFILSFPALIVLFGYSYCKRFTSLSHFVLGVALALAPIGAWIAFTGSFNPRILTLAFALFFQISAFDIIYALQDEDFDKSNKLHSIPARFGKKNSLNICFALFLAAILMHFLTGAIFELNYFYYVCAALISSIYLVGFFIFARAGLQKINLVFFYMNALCSILIMLAPLPQAIMK